MKKLVALSLLLALASTAKEVHVLNINTAPAESLALALPGVGPSMAARLDSARKVAPFRSCEDLDKVKGIGAKKLAKLCPSVVF